MRRYVAIEFALVALFLAHSAEVLAQDSVLAELYGHGVHSYFAGQYQESHGYLTTAIDQGTQDPRAFYFRGLAYTALGRPEEAKSDFQKGAELETRGADRVYPVGQSLQRVQGTTRLAIERERQQSRLAARTRTVKAAQARYEELQSAEQQVLRDPNRQPPAEAKELVGTPPTEDASDPFGDGAQPVVPQAAPEAATTAAPTAGDTDLFGDSSPMPEPTPAADPADPFATDATTDPFADDAPAATEAMPAEPASDPFADPFN